MDNELLQRILRDNSRIVVPGFGAFLRKEQGGALIFSPFLRTDDGKLKAILELEYGVSTAEAEAMIGEYAERVRTILKVKSKYYIDGVGMLMVDANGVVSFVEDKTPAAPQPQPVTPSQPVVAPAPAPAPSVTPQPVVRQPIAAAPQPAAQPVARPAAPAQPAAPSASPFARPASAPMPARPAAPVPPRPAAPIPQVPPAPSIPGAPAAPRTAPQQKGARPAAPARKPTKKSKKSDMWLVVAIIAAAVVIILMVLGIMNSSQLPPIE